MNSVQLHLALTHVPVILLLTGLTMLIISLVNKNITITKTSYMIILIAGVTALPVFFSGEGTEDAIETLPGVSKAVIENHEDLAKLAMISISATGLLALAALFSFKWLAATRALKTIVLLFAVTSGGLMVQTAHLGGQIRHTEIRGDVVMQNGDENIEENKDRIQSKKEKDDD
jgi:small-conductance mechanosensitive channel